MLYILNLNNAHFTLTEKAHLIFCSKREKSSERNMDGVMIRMQRRRRRKKANPKTSLDPGRLPPKTQSPSRERSPRSPPPTAPKKAKRRSPRMKFSGKGRSRPDSPSGPISKPTAQEIKIGGKRHWCIDGIFLNFGVEEEDEKYLKKFRVKKGNREEIRY